MWAKIVFTFLCCSLTSANVCNSCFGSCQGLDISKCDCEGETCESDHCFIMVNLFPKQQITTIVKGCSNELTGSQNGCNYVNDPKSIYCSCKGEKCNSKNFLNSYRPVRHPQVRCCECSNPKTRKKSCEPDSCTANCTGSYCFYDFKNGAQGCGKGYPSLYKHLRTRDFAATDPGTMCSLRRSSFASQSHSCICREDGCNTIDGLAWDDLVWLNSSSLPKTRLHTCYALFNKSVRPIDQSSYRGAFTCEDRHCFVTFQIGRLTTGNNRTSAFIQENFYQMEAGCLKTNEPNLIQPGCSVDWTKDRSRPLVKHCVCTGHLCNYYHLISGEDPTKFYSSLARIRNSAQTFKVQKLFVALLFLVYFWNRRFTLKV